MRSVCYSALTLVFIANSNECSSQSNGNPHYKRNPGSSSSGNLSILAECISRMDSDSECEGSTSSPPSSPVSKRYTPDRTSKEEPPLRVRSKSPASRRSSLMILGYSLRELGFIRLIPYTNNNMRFEFRRHIFESSMPIRWRTDARRYSPVPTTEQIVLSASNGDIFAILSYSGLLHGIYRTDRTHSRIKLNMVCDAVNNLTPDEIRDCPVGKRYPIFPNNFIKAFGNYDSLNSERNPEDERNRGCLALSRRYSADLVPSQQSVEEPKLRKMSKYPPGWPPSQQVIGYALTKLGYIRLIPKEEPNRQFEFRRFVFPVGMRIRWRTDRNTYVPVPTQEHIVLSTSDGEVFAILEHTGILRGIYKADQNHSRIKINMMNGAVDKMTALEMELCHVGSKYPIFPGWFDKVVSNKDSLRHVYQ